MVVIEVTQIEFMNYPMRPAQERSGSEGIYCKCYEAHRKHKRRCRIPKPWKYRGPRIGFATQVAEETPSTRWRCFNEEGLMVGLFRLGLKARRSLNEGHGQVCLVLDICSRMSQKSTHDDTCIVTAHGWFVGCWGTIEFRSDASGYEDFVAKVDIRPPAAKPFSLEASMPSSESFVQLIGGGTSSKKLAGVGSLNIHLLMGSGSTMTEVGPSEQVLPTAIKRISHRHRSGSALGVTSWNRLSTWQRQRNSRRTNSALSLEDLEEDDKESMAAENGSVASSSPGRSGWTSSKAMLQRGMSGLGVNFSRSTSRLGAKKLLKSLSGVVDSGPTPAMRSATLGAADYSTSIEIPDHVGLPNDSRSWLGATEIVAPRPQTISANVMRAIAGLFGRIKMPSRRGHLEAKSAPVRSQHARWIPESWEEIWERVALEPSGEIERFMEREFLRDCIVFFNTLFPRQDSRTFQRLRSLALDPASRYSFKHSRIGNQLKESTYSPRIMFLKRLFLCFAFCGVYCSEVGNEAHLGDLWAYPLASILGHGGRVLVCLEDVDGHDFVHFLLFGRRPSPQASGPPAPLMKRAAATHSVALDENARMLKEHRLKVTNTAHALQNIADGFSGKHLGLNLPIGGVGNPSPLGSYYVQGFTGDVLRLRRSSTSVAASAMDETRSMLSSQEDCSEDVGHFSFGSFSTGPQSPREEGPKTISSAASTHINGIDFHTVANMSSGHMYIRVDNFNESSRLCFATGVEEETPEEDLEKTASMGLDDIPRAELARQHATAERAAGILWLSSTQPPLWTWRRSRAVAASSAASTSTGGAEGVPFRLVRVQSTPTLAAPLEQEDLGMKEKRWVQGALIQQEMRRALRTPPSAAALRQLLSHYDEANTDRFGTGRYKTIEALWEELRQRRSHLVKHRGSLWRFVEPLVLQLRWRDYLLVQTSELAPHAQRAREKQTFVTTRMRPGESWNEAVHRVVSSKLNLNPADFWSSLTDRHPWENEYTLIEEDALSPSYPGIMTFYRTHLVRYTIGDQHLEMYRGCGLPVGEQVENRRVSRRVAALTSSNNGFTTTQEVLNGTRTLHWRWTPVHEAQQMQRFTNMPSSTPAERWAKYAFRHEGVVQSPPSIEALASLLIRCGVDLSKFGDSICEEFASNTKSLQSLFRELTVEQRYLRMSGGRPFRVAEPMFIRVRWRPPSGNCDEPLVLIQNESERRLIKTTKPAAEDWYKVAVRTLSMHLGVTQAQLRAALVHRPSDSSCYTSFEDRKDSPAYPGVPTLYRTHLVTYDLKEDPGPAFVALAFMASPNNAGDVEYAAIVRPVSGKISAAIRPFSIFDGHARTPSMKSRGSQNPESPTWRHTRSESPKVRVNSRRESPSMRATRSQTTSPMSMSAIVRASLAAAVKSSEINPTMSPRSSRSAPGLVSVESLTRSVESSAVNGSSPLATAGFCWLQESDALAEDIRGLRLFAQASKKQGRHTISSVLVGLEGSAPFSSSPFGTKHDASGASSSISATGGSKWREYRSHHALQVPADIGGMRTYITREKFEEFKKACEALDLGNPADDLLATTIRSREDLQRRYEEQELMKCVLSSPGHKAKEAVEWMIRQRRLAPTVNQIASSFSPIIL
mmetsp:Transcript_54201/g.129125  ORF Transcript_54201/g.129125 Transcript_54201/m.129125 type:complete len:1614 (-) Transcript_54201:355-5196(-)